MCRLPVASSARRRWAASLAAVGLSLSLNAIVTAGGSSVAPTVGQAAPPRPPYRPFRFDEDYQFLSDPARRTDFFDPIKYIPLSDADPSAHLSLGGEVRTRYEYFHNPSFGLRGLSNDDFLLQRFLPHADLRVNDHLRAFVQLVSGFQWDNESPTSPIQDDRADLQQAFADVVLGDPRGSNVTLRVGRMEMGFGSYRLVAPREPTNVRLNFDGFRGTLNIQGITVDAFLTRPVEQERDVFNDGANDNQTFWGLHSVIPVLPASAWNIDVYHFGLDRQNARFAQGVAREGRQSLGTRWWGRSAGWDYDIEAVYQFGSFGDRDIQAWTLASHVGYTFRDVAMQPRVGLKANVASGDSDRNDMTLGTFNALFPRQGYFSEINLLAPANFFDLHPSLTLKPHERVQVIHSWDFFWRYSVEDAVYGPGRVAITPEAAGDARFVGITSNIEVNWTISQHLTWSFCYVHFFAGDAVTNAGGDDADFAGSWITFKF